MHKIVRSLKTICKYIRYTHTSRIRSYRHTVPLPLFYGGFISYLRIYTDFFEITDLISKLFFRSCDGKVKCFGHFTPDNFWRDFKFFICNHYFINSGIVLKLKSIYLDFILFSSLMAGLLR